MMMMITMMMMMSNVVVECISFIFLLSVLLLALLRLHA